METRQLEGAENASVSPKNGIAIDTAPIVVASSAPQFGRVAWSGSVWIVVGTSKESTVVAYTIMLDGSVGPRVDIGTAYPGIYATPRIGCAADGCRVAMTDAFYALSSARLSALGTVLEGPAAFTPPFYSDREVGVGCTAARCLVAARSGWALRGVRTAGATVLDTAARSLAWVPNSQIQPAVAGAAGTALVAWSDTRGDFGGNNPQAALYGGRFTGASPLDTPALGLTDAGNQYLESAAFDGSDWILLYWRFSDYSRRLYAQRFSPALVPGPISSVAIPDSTQRMACNASACLVASSEETAKLVGRIIPKGGGFGAAFTISETSRRYTFAVGASVDGFLVAYGDYEPSKYPVFAKRIRNDGTVVDSTPIRLPVDATTVRAASVNSVWMLATRIAGGATTQIVRMSAAGSVLDPIPLTIAGAPPTELVDARDGHSAFLAYGAGRGTFVTADGRVLDPSGFGVEPGAVAAFAPGRLLLAYSKYRDTFFSTYLATEVVTRLIESGTLDGGACTASDTCASRYCVDGACCDRACTGPCEDCRTGKCLPVASADDADTCTGTTTCNASSACKSKPGIACTAAADCASGHCVDGVCCTSACDTCGVCNATPGTCTPRAAGAALCTPYVCDGSSIACPTSCADDATCAADHYCAADKKCTPRKALGNACGVTDCATTGCRVCSSGHCVDGVCCDSACDGAARPAPRARVQHAQRGARPPARHISATAAR